MSKKTPDQLNLFEYSISKNKKTQNKLNLFISYSHEDETFIEEFEDYISKLKNVNCWRDRKLLIGENLKKIPEKLNVSDIICIFLSSNFLNSKSCRKELEDAKQLKKDKAWTHLCPIILSNCEWKNKTGLKEHYLVLPEDAKPMDSFSDPERKKIWMQIYEHIKKITNKELQMRKIEISKKFRDFLNDTEILTETHSQKTKLLLEDIFIHPNLSKHGDQETEVQNINSKELFDELMGNKQVLIYGKDISGKTALCKNSFSELRRKKLVPIFLSEQTDYRGQFKTVMEREYKRQYKDIVSYKNIDNNKIIPIVDNFHLITNTKEIKNNQKFIRF